MRALGGLPAARNSVGSPSRLAGTHPALCDDGPTDAERGSGRCKQVEFIKNEDYKYVRALGAFYMRLVGTSLDVYQYLEVGSEGTARVRLPVVGCPLAQEPSATSVLRDVDRGVRLGSMSMGQTSSGPSQLGGAGTPPVLGRWRGALERTATRLLHVWGNRG